MVRKGKASLALGIPDACPLPFRKGDGADTMSS